MKHFSTALLAFALAAIPVTALADDSGALLDLTDRATFNQCTQTSIKYDREDYDAWTFNNYNNYPYMYNSYLYEPYYSDYLISPSLTLQTNTLYRIELSPAAYTSGKTAKVTVGLGQGDDMTAYNVLQTFDNIPHASIDEAEQKTVEFNVQTDGQYKIYLFGEGTALCLYNTRMYSVGASGVPAAVSDLMVLPASDGSASATISFTLPSQSISGHPIDGNIKYRIYRGEGESPIKSGRGITDEYITYTDNNVEVGDVTYSVEVENGGNVSARASYTTYVGPETPNPVTDLTLAKSGNTYTLSWTAPDTGVHGALLDRDALTYVISRIIDGQATVISHDCATTSFTDSYSSEELHSMSYSVAAVLNGASSTAVETETVSVGYINLPFADSFAGASFGSAWQAEPITGSYNWMAVATNPYSTQKPAVTDGYDGDGGFAFYNSWSAPRGNSARLYTAPIKNVAGTAPIIEFYLFHTQYGNDNVKVQVSCDNGEWTDVPDAVAPLKGDVLDWEKYSFPISSAISATCETYRVALVAQSQNGHNTVLDKVRIFVPANKDLEASSPVAPAMVYSGNDINLSFTLANNGQTAVNAADYTLSLVTDYPTPIVLPENTDIAALGSAMVSVTVPVTAIESRNADIYHFALNVEYAGDENLANNTSAPAEVEVQFVTGDVPSNPIAEQQEDGSIKLTWDAAGDQTEPLNVGTSFENMEAGFTGPFNGFTSLDLDAAAGETYYLTSGSAFNVVSKPAYPKGSDGDNMIGLTLGANKQQDDWLISPLLDCPQGSTMNLSFLIATKKFSSSSYYYSMEILYSTEDEYDAAQPATAFSHLVASKTSSLSYGDFIMSETFVPINIADIPAEAKRIAIHFKSKLSLPSAMWIDNIRITENVTNPLLGYNVYEEGVARVNDAAVPATQTTYSIADTDIHDRQYFITAVYPAGESEPSELTSLITAVDEIGSDGLTVYTTADGLYVTGVTGQVTVYDIQGRIAASVSSDALVRLAPGIYIVRAGDEARKVMIRK